MGRGSGMIAEAGYSKEWLVGVPQVQMVISPQHLARHEYPIKTLAIAGHQATAASPSRVPDGHMVWPCPHRPRPRPRCVANTGNINNRETHMSTCFCRKQAGLIVVSASCSILPGVSPRDLGWKLELARHGIPQLSCTPTKRRLGR